MSGRPPVSRLALAARVALPLLAAGLLPGGALAGGFADRTPLPRSVTGGGGGASAAPAHAASTGSAFVRMLVGLLIVVAVIYAVYWLLKAYARSKKQVAQADERLEVVATTPLASDRSVHLLRVGEELIVVGSAPSGVTPIRVYSVEEARRLAPLLDSAAPLQAVSDPSSPRPPTLLRLVDDLRRRTAR